MGRKLLEATFIAPLHGYRLFNENNPLVQCLVKTQTKSWLGTVHVFGTCGGGGMIYDAVGQSQEAVVWNMEHGERKSLHKFMVGSNCSLAERGRLLVVHVAR